MVKPKKSGLVPKLRFPEFRGASEWSLEQGDGLFDAINTRAPTEPLPILAITQEFGAIPRDQIDYHVSVTDQSLESYKLVEKGDFIISLRSFQGGIEYSNYRGICSPAYVILRRKGIGSDSYFRHLFKSSRFIQQLTRNIEGLRDGKMISFKQFSEQQIPTPPPEEQQRIADCLTSLDELIAAQGRKVEVLKTYKRGLMQQLFPREGETIPRLRFSEYCDKWHETMVGELCSNISSGKDKTDADGKFDLYGSTGIIGKTDSATYNGGYLLVARVGANAGFLTSVNGSFGATDNVLVIEIKTGVNREFVGYCLANFGLNRLSFGSGQPLITGGQLKALRIGMPTEREQFRIASALSSLDAQIVSEDRFYTELRTQKQALMQQLFPIVEEG